MYEGQENNETMVYTVTYRFVPTGGYIIVIILYSFFVAIPLC